MRKRFFSLFTFILSIAFIYNVFDLSLSADDGSSSGNNCFIGENCPICNILCSEDECYCLYFVIAIVLFLMCVVAICIRLLGKHKINSDEDKAEEDTYRETYMHLMNEETRRKKEQEIIEAKLNGEEGYEDYIIELHHGDVEVKSNKEDDEDEFDDFPKKKEAPVGPESEVKLDFSKMNDEEKDNIVFEMTKANNEDEEDK